MIVVRDDLWLCEDCMIFAVNGDLSGIDYHYSGEEAEKRAKEVTDGVAKFGPHLVPDFDSETGKGCDEFSWRGCDGCGLAGTMHRFAVLGTERVNYVGDANLIVFQRDPTAGYGPAFLVHENENAKP